MIRKIKEFIYKIKGKAFKESTEPVWKGMGTNDVISYAFTIGGTRYFWYSNPLSIGHLRHEMLLGVLQEFHNRATKEFSKASLEQIKECLNQKMPKITEASKIIDTLLERYDWQFEPILVFKLASCLFFDETENPYKYDYIYNQAKINKWINLNNKGETLAFFLNQPLIDGLIHLRLSNESLNIYTKTLIDMERRHLKNLAKIMLLNGTNTPYQAALDTELATLDMIM